MNIAIIGGGIAGNTLAYHLHQQHQITLFEANDYIGGHTHTHQVEVGGETHAVDTGFIVFNDKTYPQFERLLREAGVAWRDSSMSFSVRNELTGLEYNGTTFNSLFAQRRNLLSPAFYRMVRDILRFNKQSLSLLAPGTEIALGEYLQQHGYSRQFIRDYIIPMGAAIWSTDAEQMLQFPARFFVRFFHHHGMLTIDQRPQWRTIVGGSAAYLQKLTAGYRDRIELNCPVASVQRHAQGVTLNTKNGQSLTFDYVFFACHSDEALRILGVEATAAESDILAAIPYQDNTVYLHTDARLMPKRKLAWAAWNYHVTPSPSGKVQVTYNMNILQGIQSAEPLLVTLNYTDAIDPAKIIKKLHYRHPLYTLQGARAQARHADISGHNRTGYAGAYWRNGFHEDGVVSALAAIDHFKVAMR
ncbi:NAD(P)/FAD-dependent oxidoreductase [Methylophilus sp. QUAN]|uniref:NAD(P)/FAD-dependent oxidoreductase n=1 Tax=Methylophilus sp. QUAN TaxID=2781020 RepID=UPI00188F76A9|nr:FAD-dependent oxidoreductase [Methylophilus sp. QUAN]MBF4991786.1 FAD-dependent oxidoreductase [Methylophilus sp. QUAN]